MKLNTDIIVVGTGTDSATAGLWLEALQDACDEFEINTTNRVSAFLANVGVECAGFRVFEENLNYSAQGLANTWPNRYAANPQGQPKAPNELAMHLQRNPMAIANNVYANRLGNGDEVSGDGWRYRGVGPIQLTGATVQEACIEALGLPDGDADFNAELHQPVGGSRSAAWFFAVYKGCLLVADKDQFSSTVQLVNGQMPCDANQGPLRIARYKACVSACNAAATPAPVAATTKATGTKLPPVKT